MRKTTLAAALAAVLLSAAPAVAKTTIFQPQEQSGLRLNKMRPVGKRSLPLTPKSVDENGAIIPDVSESTKYFQSISSFGTLIGPDDKDWFYMLEPEVQILSQSPSFVDYNYTGFKIKVYDDNMNFVGQASGSIEIPEDAKKCERLTIGSQITRSFFNMNGSDYEIMIIGNFNPKQGYGAKERTFVYSLKPEGTETPCLTSIPGAYVVARNASTNVSENFWMAFYEESTWASDAENPTKFSIYSRAGYGTPVKHVGDLEYDPMLVVSDGQNDGVLPLTANVSGNNVFFALWHFEKTFFEDPTDPSNDKLTPDNNFVVELYKGTSSGLDLVKTTKIPMSLPEGEFNLRSYSMGNFLGADDLSFDFNTGDMPGYIVSVYDSQIQGDATKSYYAVYDVDGNQLLTFGEDNAGYSGMSNVPGHPDQYCFDMESKTTGEHGLVLVNYPSMTEAGFIPKVFVYEDDIWALAGNPDRLITAKGVRYVAPIQPTNGNVAAREQYVGFFTADGTLDHVDHLQVPGDGIAKILTFIEGSALNPYLFNTSKTTEYLMWIYRYKGTSDSETTVELAITDDKGNILASRMMPDGNRMPFCMLCNSEDNPSLSITYSLAQNGEDLAIRETIKLPVNKFEGEGTVESPYLIKTFGDLDQVRNNLTSNFAVANSFDCEGRSFRPIEGNFTGSIDGNGNEITGLLIKANSKGAALFEQIGQNVIPDDEEAPVPVTATIKNLTLYQPVVRAEAANNVREFAFLAAEARNALVENVHVVEPSFDAPENLKATVGLLVNSALDSEITGSSVKDAEISLPASEGLGGIANIVAGGSVKASSFSGKLSASQNVGGIAVQNRSQSAVFDDCHVNADLAAHNTVGGIIATSSRSAVSRSLVEGTIAATQPVQESTEEDVILTYNAGGIVGKLESASYETPDAEGFLAIDKCVVALDALTLSSEAEHAEAVGAHRIVGWTSIDGGPVTEWVMKDEYTMDPVVHPAEPEARLGQNFVISQLAEVEVFDPALTTEGTTFAGTADQAWFASLGYAFDGATFQEPWMLNSERPELFHEASVGTALYITETEIEGVEGTEVNVPLVLRGIEPDALTFSSTDEEGAAVSNLVEPCDAVISLLKPGTYTITATNYFKTATLKVTVKQYVGLDQVGNDTASAITFNGSVVKAEGCAIAVYNAQGQLVASGNDAVDASKLLAGVYVAKAVAADGSASTLKFAVN